MADIDPAVELAAVQASIATITSQLNSGITQQSDGIRMMRFDLPTLREQLDILLARQATLLVARPRVRRVLTYPAGKGL